MATADPGQVGFGDTLSARNRTLTPRIPPLRESGSERPRESVENVTRSVARVRDLPRHVLGGERLPEPPLVLGGEVRLEDLEVIARELRLNAL